MQILGLMRINFDTVIVFVTNFSLLFRLAQTIHTLLKVSLQVQKFRIRDLVRLFEDGAKLKTPSEIFPSFKLKE